MAVIGALLVLGLVADWTAARVPVPRVSALILLGVLVGPVGLDLLPPDREQWFPVVAAIALVMVGFLIGGEFTAERIRALGHRAGAIAATQAVVAGGTVAGGLLLLGADGRLALPLGGVAAATAPAAIIGVVSEVGRDRPFPRLLLAVAALADAVSLVLFSVLLVVAGLLYGTGDVGATVQSAAWELGGGVGLGVALGVPGALLTGRLEEGRPLLEEALGLVLLCAGIGMWLEVSFLLAAVVMGAVVANLASHHDRALREIEGIEWPSLVLFFVLSGASLELDALAGAGLATAGYLVLRTAGKVAGGWLGGRIVRAPESTARWIGPALLPQAGVALGLALLAERQLPDVGSDVMAVVIASTVVFELAGPVCTRLAVRRATKGRQAEAGAHRPS